MEDNDDELKGAVRDKPYRREDDDMVWGSDAVIDKRANGVVNDCKVK